MKSPMLKIALILAAFISVLASAKSPIQLIWNRTISYDPIVGDDYLFAKLIRDTHHMKNMACSAEVFKEVEEVLKRNAVQKLSQSILDILADGNPLDSLKVHVCDSEGAISIEGLTGPYGTQVKSYHKYEVSKISNFITNALKEIRQELLRDLKKKKNPLIEYLSKSSNSSFMTVSSQKKQEIFENYNILSSYQSCEIVGDDKQNIFLISPKTLIPILRTEDELNMSINMGEVLEIKNLYTSGTRQSSSFHFYNWEQFFETLSASKYCEQIKIIHEDDLEIIAKSSIHHCNLGDEVYIKIREEKFILSPSEYTCLR